MNANEFIDIMDKIYFIDEENPLNIKMIYVDDNKMRSWDDNIKAAEKMNLLDYTDWKVPTIDEYIWILDNVKIQYKIMIIGKYWTCMEREEYDGEGKRTLAWAVSYNGRSFYEWKKRRMYSLFIRKGK